MKFCYADPPYPGCAGYYAEKTEVDHEELIERLVDEFPDGWALSSHSPALHVLLPLCPKDVRIMAWVKPWAAFRPNVNPAYAWEPVLVRGGRKRGRELDTVRDWVSANITIQRGMIGVKPDTFSFWIFEVLGMVPDDDFVDLYPGTGAVTDAWKRYRRQFVMPIESCMRTLEVPA